MSQLDDAINGLSSDELDTLNGDPKMLSDFKSKYTPSSIIPSSLGTAFDKGVVDPYKDAVSDAWKNIAGMTGGAIVNATKLGGEALAAPAELAQGIAKNDVQMPTVLKDTQTQTDAMAEGAKDFASHPIDSIAKHPVSTGLAIAALAGPESIISKILPETEASSSAKFLKQVANMPERATQYEGYKQPIPTQDELAGAIQKVQSAVKSVWQEHGDLLNKAKKGAGIPSTEDEIVDSVRKYGNNFGLDLNKPLELPENMKHNSSPMEEDTLGATSKDQNVSGEPMPKELQKPMAYKLGDHDTPQQLMTEVNRFKSNLPYISKADQAKAASYLQDQIVQQGVFKTDTAKGSTMGVLKSQYRDLKDVIVGSSDNLQAAKGKMADLYNTMEDISNKISEGPGSAEAYLRRLFKSQDPSTKDDLKALTKIEVLSGKPVLTELFKKFAGEAYGKALGQNVHSITQLPYAAATSPKYVLKPLAKVAKLPKLAASGLGVGFNLRQSNPQSNSILQSTLDKMKNNQ